ncbi:MAG TPA: hypothetical protein VK890_06000, partial [Bacteroidia bacterium]|nr:hypothetical protein [Bacteroidia bacterium]
MKQSEYIKLKLENNKIKGIESAQYEYHEYSETHFVRVVPVTIVDGDVFDNELSQIIIDFENEFPGEMLCFI